MPVIDDINEKLRDFVGWNAQNPLPIGDPRTGVHNLSKSDLRDLFLAILQAQGNPEALTDLQRQIGEAGRIYASRAAAETAVSALPTSVTQILVREGTALVARSRTAFADDPLYPTGARWGVVQRQDFDAERVAREQAVTEINGRVVPNYESREAAVENAANLPPEVDEIFVREGDNLILRTAISANDSLYPMGRRWGIAASYPQTEAVTAPIKGVAKDARQAWGRAFGRGDSEIAQKIGMRVITEGGDTALAWDMRGNPVLSFGVIFGRGDDQPVLPPPFSD